ncbi:FadR family transcriptional regulator [Photobacterium sanctipauli]|uniref:FadR family transcriptional regulator n=1 Tax=Photobacterium sanctipauli TaxID=1342794 RepID=A0A2T3NZP7_9GAMM|nr:FCD domain-containing protein [Photobacterium sanctipauli]PSW21753.1 FadR family transcriptional regulator [Photobacterium sanctipauli]
MAGSSKGRRTQQLAESIKAWIVQQALQPGDRLPSEQQVMEIFDASKSTVRESMRILEAQGILITKTGPKGGAFVTEMSEGKAQALLSNYLFFKKFSISDLYQIRLTLEPEIAASLAGTLNDDQVAQLHNQIDKYMLPPEDVYQEREHHIASIEFHSLLASYSGNELLKFVVRFTAQMLTELTIYKKLYEPGNHKLWHTGVQSQRALVDALQKGDAVKAKQVMEQHMLTAHQLMKQQEAEMANRFLTES